MDCLTRYWNYLFKHDHSSDINSESHLTRRLEMAAETGDLDLIKRIVAEKNILLDEQRSTFYLGYHSPLMVAIENNHIQVVRFLIEKGSNMNLVSFRTAETPLLIAVKTGNLLATKCLIENGVNFNKRYYFEGSAKPLLMIAILNSHPEIFKYLLSVGVNILLSDSNQQNILTSPLSLQHSWVMKILLENFDLKDYQSRDGNTPLIIASAFGYLETIKLLIEDGVHVNRQNKKGMTALMMAIEGQQLEVVRYLTKRKNLNYDLTNHKGQTALDMIAYSLNPDPIRESILHLVLTGKVKNLIQKLKSDRSLFIFLLPSDIFNIIMDLM